MVHSTVQDYVHIMWSTKGQQPLLEPSLRDQVVRYIHALIRNHQSLLIDGVVCQDHVHLLIDLNPSFSLSDLVRDIKVGTTVWL